MLELTGPATALLDEPLAHAVRPAPPIARWRARCKDDDDRVWKAEAETVDGLDAAWAPAKRGVDLAALRSLHPLAVELRAEAEDGRSAARTIRRVLVADGVKVRRIPGTRGRLLLPAGARPERGIVLTDPGPDAVVTAALLASRGVLVALGDPGPLDLALEPLEPDALLLPPGVPGATTSREAWAALLAHAGASSSPAIP